MNDFPWGQHGTKRGYSPRKQHCCCCWLLADLLCDGLQAKGPVVARFPLLPLLLPWPVHSNAIITPAKNVFYCSFSPLGNRVVRLLFDGLPGLSVGRADLPISDPIASALSGGPVPDRLAPITGCQHGIEVPGSAQAETPRQPRRPMPVHCVARLPKVCCLRWPLPGRFDRVGVLGIGGLAGSTNMALALAGRQC